MAKQPDVDEGDDWVPSKAASVCLMLIAQCVPTEILPHVIPFVAQNIGSPDWHYKDAACIAFGKPIHIIRADTQNTRSEALLQWLSAKVKNLRSCC